MLCLQNEEELHFPAEVFSNELPQRQIYHSQEQNTVPVEICK